MSVGFIVIYLYQRGYTGEDIYPFLVAFLSVVLATEAMRFSSDRFNVLYCKVLGPLMRQSEVKSRVNGVAYYLAGCNFSLYLFPPQIAAMSIMFLSWADPMASIFGRLWGRYTPKFGRKSLAGSFGAMLVGSLVTYGFLMNHTHAPLYTIYGGLVAGFSEALGDSAGLDDNLVIPVLSSLLLWIPLVGLGL
ncbi:hypothetical protein BX666DRAFT_205150 [Dichotomocladium elegans]|nr:hypothetical protein BX666DRAFT_205150 [Dichotomocladium elegans]